MTEFLDVTDKHFIKCKGHFKSYCLFMSLEVFQVSFHHYHETNIYYENAVQVWTIHGRNKKSSNLSPKPYEGTSALLCLLLFERVRKLVQADILKNKKFLSQP
jgi:hypothetical protein